MLNAKKTKMILFRKKSIPPGSLQQQVSLNSEKLTFNEDAKFLGITIDGTLSWDKHCTEVANTMTVGTTFPVIEILMEKALVKPY